MVNLYCSNFNILVYISHIYIYNCKKIINRNLFFEELIKINHKTDTVENITKFNILSSYPHSDLGTIVSGYLVSGSLEINKQINWIIKNKIYNCKIISIHINCEPVNKCNEPQILTVCLNMDKNYKLKNGILSNSILLNKNQINFQFFNFTESKLPNNVSGFLANRIVNLTNIFEIKMGEYVATIDNYYDDNNIIIIDTDIVKGFILIKHLEC